MSEKEEEIDLNKITIKSLVFRLIDKVENVSNGLEEVKQELKSNDEKYVNLAVRVNTIETKVKLWGVVAGIATSALITILARFIQ